MYRISIMMSFYVAFPLQRHLSDVDFEAIFHMSRTDFYRLPQWRRNDLKKRAKLY